MVTPTTLRVQRVSCDAKFDQSSGEGILFWAVMMRDEQAHRLCHGLASVNYLPETVSAQAPARR